MIWKTNWVFVYNFYRDRFRPVVQQHVQFFRKHCIRTFWQNEGIISPQNYKKCDPHKDKTVYLDFKHHIITIMHSRVAQILDKLNSSLNFPAKTKMKRGSDVLLTQSAPNCLKHILTLAKILGVFPLNNIRRQNVTELRFAWGSWTFVLTILQAFGYLICASFSFYKAMTVGILLNQLSK